MSIHKKKLGLLGGGQLARMLCLKARHMGIDTVVLSEKKTDPAAMVCTKWIKGNTLSVKDLKKLLRASDCITFESEFVSAQLLEKAIKPIKNKKILPNLNCLRRLQDRLFQKEWLYEHNLPTLPFIRISSKDEIDAAFEVFNQRLVFKKRMGGYDGYGTFIVKNNLELEAFKKSIKGFESHFIVEPFTDFKSERSIILARNEFNEISVLPLIKSKQINNQCDYVVGPSKHKQTTKLISQLTQFLKDINYVGVIAFELFEVGSELIINEIAPRVHNTGHFSQDALTMDQFELHIRSVMGLHLPIDNKLASSAFVMVNLLGTSTRVPLIKNYPTGILHWYEKTENRPKRKLGHINYVGKSQTKLLKKALTERKGILI
jgi:5-(carboxyamino)imidazole ribonucleotide synthase